MRMRTMMIMMRRKMTKGRNEKKKFVPWIRRYHGMDGVELFLYNMHASGLGLCL